MALASATIPLKTLTMRPRKALARTVEQNQRDRVQHLIRLTLQPFAMRERPLGPHDVGLRPDTSGSFERITPAPSHSRMMSQRQEASRRLR
jgi:hypothetical protein